MKDMRRPEKQLNKSVFVLVAIALVFSIVLSVPTVYAEESYDLTELPMRVGEYFGISIFAAGLIVSALFILFPTMITGLVMKRSANTAILYAILVVDFVTMGFLVALAWLPYWIFLILCLIIALLFAGQIRDMITGG